MAKKDFMTHLNKASNCIKKNKTYEKLFDEIRKQVENDLDNFATRTKLVNLKPNDNLNVKQMFYRTSTLFISALGRICGAESSSCFDIINELAEQQKISENTKHKLSYAVAIACEIRLRVYMKAQSQRDYIQPHKNSNTIFDEILTFTDIESIVSYFQIAYCLQREFIEKLGIKGSHVYSNSSLMNITICYALRLDAPMLALLKDNPIFFDDTDSEQINIVDKNNFFTCFDKYLTNMENEMKNCTSKMISKSPDPFLMFNAFDDAAFDKDHENLEERTEFFVRMVEILQRSSLGEEDRKKITEDLDMDINTLIGFVNLFIATYQFELNQFDEVSIRMNQAFENLDETNNRSEYLAIFYSMAGNNCFKMKEYEKSLICLQIVLGICLSFDLGPFAKIFDDGEVANMYAGIGICLFKLNQFDESLINFEIAVEKMEDFCLEEFNSFAIFNPTSTYHNLGKCLMRLGNFEKGMSFLFQALKITENEIADQENDIKRLKNRASIFTIWNFCK